MPCSSGYVVSCVHVCLHDLRAPGNHAAPVDCLRRSLGGAPVLFRMVSLHFMRTEDGSMVLQRLRKQGCTKFSSLHKNCSGSVRFSVSLGLSVFHYSSETRPKTKHKARNRCVFCNRPQCCDMCPGVGAMGGSRNLSTQCLGVRSKANSPAFVGR